MLAVTDDMTLTWIVLVIARPDFNAVTVSDISYTLYAARTPALIVNVDEVDDSPLSRSTPLSDIFQLYENPERTSWLLHEGR